MQHFDVTRVVVPPDDWELVLEIARAQRLPGSLPDSLKKLATGNWDRNYAIAAAVVGEKNDMLAFDAVRDGIEALVGEGKARAPLAGMLEALGVYKGKPECYECWEMLTPTLRDVALLEPSLAAVDVPIKRDYEYRSRAIELLARPPHRIGAVPPIREALYAILTELHTRAEDLAYKGRVYVHAHIVQAAREFQKLANGSAMRIVAAPKLAD